MNYVVLVFIVFITNQCEAGGKVNPHIIFERSSAGTVEQALRYTVVMNKSLHIYFRDMVIFRGWCFDYYNHMKELDEWMPPIYKKDHFHFKNVTAAMSNLWKCNVSEKIRVMVNNPTTIELKNHVFYLNLHVKGAKAVKIYINYQEVKFSKPNLSDRYDGYAFYHYEDGQHVKFECRNLEKTGSVHLEYIKKGTTTVFNSKTIKMQLFSRKKPVYFDCVYTNDAPLEVYVYRVTFILNKPLFAFNETKTLSHEKKSANQDTVKISTSTDTNTDTAKKSASQDTDENVSPIILGSSIGAVLVLLGVIGVAYFFVRRRNSKRSEAPYVDVSNQEDNQTPQHSNEIDNQYDLCHYNDSLSRRETYTYNTPEGVEHTDPKDHFYTEIVYFTCKVKKADEIQTRNSQVYDEPYVQITINNNV